MKFLCKKKAYKLIGRKGRLLLAEKLHRSLQESFYWNVGEVSLEKEAVGEAVGSHHHTGRKVLRVWWKVVEVCSKLREVLTAPGGLTG